MERDADRELDETVSSGQTLVAVAGVVLAGRTRTLAEVARRHLSDSWFVWFNALPGVPLADLVSEARRLSRGGPVVLWIENADLPLLSQLSAQLLDELPPGFRILITLDGGLLNSGVLPGEAAEILNAPGVCVRLGLVTNKERERLAAEPAYAKLAAMHEDEAILMGRMMASLNNVIEAIATPDEDAVSRAAVLHAAVDWQCAAVPKALTRDVIEELYHGGYWQQLAARKKGAAASRSRFQQAIKQLLLPSPGLGLRLLEEMYSGKVIHLRPHPLLIAVAESPERPPGWVISENLWNYLVQALNNDQRLAVGLNAASRADYRHARRLLNLLDTALIPPKVMLEIALDAHDSGAATAARSWYEKAIASGHAEAAPKAMCNLGRLEADQGRVDQARTWYEKAIASGHAEAAPNAMCNLGRLEARQGRVDQARTWYEKAIASGHAEAAPKAMCNLGRLEADQGRVDQARTWYEKAIASGHAEAAPKAMYNLGLLEADQGRVDQARTWYEKAIASGHAEAAPNAMCNLGLLEADQGRVDQARTWYEKAIASGHAEAAPKAIGALGSLEARQGRVDQARTWYEKAIASGHAEAAPNAMYNLGLLEAYQGRVDQARTWYEKAIASGDAEAAPKAMCNLGRLEADQGRVDQARTWYEKAIASGDAEAAPNAMYNLGLLEARQGRVDQARTWYEEAIASGHLEVASLARGQLNQLKRHQDNLQRAKNFTKYSSPFIDSDYDQPPSGPEPTVGDREG